MNYRPHSTKLGCPSKWPDPTRSEVCLKSRRPVPLPEANALLKAHGSKEIGPSDAWFLADDSGIEIDALDGRPGRISAHAGEPCDDEANNDKVIEEMKEVEEGDRDCRFRCVLALVGNGLEETFSGACEGTLLFERRGSGGFGYDPLFCPMRASLLLLKFPSRKRLRLATVHGLYLS